mgnify:CR=1 FL=1
MARAHSHFVPALGAVRRWLAPGGEIHVAGFGPPEDLAMRLASEGARRERGLPW